jgi:predicted nuclease of predicted toxin-antitoxin system
MNLIDMNLSPRWCSFLGTHGYSAIHWQSIGRADAPDTELVNWALEKEQVIVTSDLDFGTLVALSGKGTPSIIQIRGGDLTPECIGAHVTSAIRTQEDQLKSGAILTVDGRRGRLRLLPLSEN